MAKIILRRVSDKEYVAVNEVLSNNKFIVISHNPEEGVSTEIPHNLTNNELFLIYRKLRKKYLKLRNL